MVKKIDSDVYKYILNEEWKGNIRELKNFAEKAVIFSKNDEISLSQLGLKFESLKEKFGSFSLAKKEFEKNYLEKALAANNFNISQTAKMLIMDKGNLFKKIKSLGIKIEDSKDSN
jgi:two-component system nitrogen regulation response regulator NtrX